VPFLYIAGGAIRPETAQKGPSETADSTQRHTERKWRPGQEACLSSPGSKWRKYLRHCWDFPALPTASTPVALCCLWYASGRARTSLQERQSVTPTYLLWNKHESFANWCHIPGLFCTRLTWRVLGVEKVEALPIVLRKNLWATDKV